MGSARVLPHRRTPERPEVNARKHQDRAGRNAQVIRLLCSQAESTTDAEDVGIALHRSGRGSGSLATAGGEE